jgi:hypothetical protein
LVDRLALFFISNPVFRNVLARTHIMKVIQFEGTIEEFKVIAYLFSASPHAQTMTLTTSPEVMDTPAAHQPPATPAVAVTPVEAIHALARRLPPSEGQKKLFQALKDGPVSKEELLDITGWTAAELRGTLGALGKRVNGTPAVHAAGLPPSSDAIIQGTRQGDSWIYALQEYALEALRDEGLL